MKTIRRFFTLVLVAFCGLLSVSVLHAEASDIIIPEFSLDNVTLAPAPVRLTGVNPAKVLKPLLA